MDLNGVLKKYTDWARPRMRPAFIIIGTQKAGTSSLFNILKTHPRILAPSHKEIHFFDRETSYNKGLRHYLSNFPIEPLRKTGHITFEATPSYLYYADKVAQRIQRHLPGTACVAIHEITGRTKDPRLKYLARGRYSEQIARFKACIPHDLLHVHSYLDLKKDTSLFTTKLCEKLGLSPIQADDPILGSHANKRPYMAPLDKTLAQELYTYFSPEMERLKDVLGFELDIMEGHG